MSSHGYILIVEDDTTILELMAEYLQEEGYVVATALTGDDALHTPMAAPPQLILLDYGVSDKEGQSLAEIRQHPPWDGIPIVLVSGHANLEHVAQVEGCAGFVRKPFEIEELLEVVRKFLP